MEKKHTNNLVLLIVALVVVGGGAFYGGMQYNQHKMTANRTGRFQGAEGLGMVNRTTSGGSFSSGEILSRDDKSITIKLPDGGSKLVFVSDSTEISKFAAGTIADLIVGQQVSTNGSANTDGSINATSVQLRPNLPATTESVNK